MNRSKDDLRYWFEHGLFKEKTTYKGVRKQLPDWHCKIRHEGRRERFPLRTPNRAQAASKAREIYKYVQLHGWADTLAKYKPEKTGPIGPEFANIQTVGDFLQALKETDIPEKRLEGYANALRGIVASVAGIPRGGRGGNRQAALNWRTDVEKVSLSILTPASIANWKKLFLVGYPDDPVSQRRAKISVNSLLRRAKSLFAPKYLRQINTKVSLFNPFSEIRFEKKQSQRYRSTFNIYNLIAAAKEELKEREPELFKIFLLASCAGLRRKEIDCLLWDQIKFDAGIIRIEPTKFYHPKSEDSIGDIEVDGELLAVLKEMKLPTVSNFVIESSVEPQPDATFDHYRCSNLFEKLIVWLKAHGVQGTKPLHELRKEFGSLVADAHGIYVASRMLRHSDISVTANHYLDKKTRKTVGLGAHL
jgi:integrase